MADRTVKVEILGDAKGLRGAFGDAGSAADGFGSKLGSMGKAVAVAGVALAGGLAVGLASCVKAAAESQKVMAQTEAVIKSTGGSAGLTANQVADLATKLSTVNPIDDEVIQQAENMLLTFTNIGGTVMPAATQAALDMSVAMGTDAVSASTMLGKALNDPAAGVSKLTKVGVTFTDAQKEQIKTMQEAGDVAGAQGIILAELQKEFGGSAEAAGKTFAGQLTILKTQLGNVQESIGMALIPVLTRLLPYVALAANWLGQRLPGAIAVVSEWISRIVARLSGPLHAAFVMVRDGVLTFVQALQGNWTDDSKIAPLHRAIGIIGTVIREQVIPFVKQMADFFENRVIPAFQKVMPVVQQIIGALSGGGGLAGILERLTAILGPLADQFLRWAGEMLVKLLDQVGAWGRALVEWIAPQIPPLLVELGKIALAIGVWAKDVALPAIAAQLLVWGQAFIDWIGPQIGPMLSALGDLLAQLGAWLIDTALPAVAEKLGQWGGAFIAWVQPQIVPLLAELGKLLEQLGGWLIDTALPAIGAKLLEWGTAFVAWVAPQIPPLLLELGKLLLSLGDWLITTALPAILEKLGQWALAFIAWVAPQIPPLLVELGGLLAALGDWVITTAAPEIATKLLEWATKFLEWIALDVLPELPGKLLDILNTVTGWIADQAYVIGNKLLTEWVPKFLGFVADVVSGLPEKLLNIITSISSWVAEKAGDIASSATDIGVNVLKGIASAIYDSFEDVVAAALSWLADKIPDKLKGFLKIGSPSKVVHDEVGAPIMQGLIDGILDGVPALLAALQTVADTIAPGWKAILDPLNPISSGPLAPGWVDILNPGATAPDLGTTLPPGWVPILGGGGSTPPATNPWDNLTSNPVQPPAGSAPADTPAPLPAPWESGPTAYANQHDNPHGDQHAFNLIGAQQSGALLGQSAGYNPAFGGPANAYTPGGTYTELAAVIKQAMKDGMREAMSGAMG